MPTGHQGPNKPRAATSVPNLRSKTSGIFRYPPIRVNKFSKVIRISRTVVSPSGKVVAISLDGHFDNISIERLLTERKASLFELPQQYAGKEVGVVLHLNNPNYPINFDLALVFSLEQGFPLLAFLEKHNNRSNRCIFTPENARFKGQNFSEARFRLLEEKGNGRKYFDLCFPTGEIDFDFIRRSCPHLLPVLKQSSEDFAFGEVYFRFLVLANGKIEAVKIGDKRGVICELEAKDQFPFGFTKTTPRDSGVMTGKERKGVGNSTLNMPEIEAKFGLLHLGFIKKFLEQGDGKKAFDYWKDRSRRAKEKILLNLNDAGFERWFDMLWQDSVSRESAVSLLKNLQMKEMLNFVYQYKTTNRSEADLLLEMLGRNEQEIQKWRCELDIDNISSKQIIAFLMILPASETNMASLLLADAELPREEELEVVNAMKDKFPLLRTMFGSIIEEFKD